MAKTWIVSFDRFNVAPLLKDYGRSLVDVASGKRDVVAIAACFLAPCGMFLLSFCLEWKIFDPGAIFGGVALLAGVLLAGFSQLAGFRLRVAERALGTTPRQSHLFREAIALVLLASLVAIATAVALGIANGLSTRPVSRVLTALILGLAALLLLLVVATIRRLYLTYLEVFENGATLPKRGRHVGPEHHGLDDSDFDAIVSTPRERR